MKTSIPRLSSIKLKGGTELHILRNTIAEDTLRAYDRDVSSVRHAHEGGLCGFAIVAWSVDGSTSTSMRASDGRYVGAAMVPDFARSALIEHLSDTRQP